MSGISWSLLVSRGVVLRAMTLIARCVGVTGNNQGE